MKILYLIFFMLFAVSSFGQIETKEIPFAFTHKIDYAKIKPFLLTEFDKTKLLNEDKAMSLLKPFAFAKNFKTNISFDYNYSIENNDFFIVYQKIIVPNADGLALVFSDFNLEKGEKIFIFDNSHKYLIGALSEINNKSNGILPTRFLPSDTLIIEYQYSKDKTEKKVYISSIAAAYRDMNFKSEWCEIDINCDDDIRWQTIKRAVAKITFKSKKDSKYYVCTGSLVANTQFDNTPYFITANHCISTEDEANSAVFYFNYEADLCDGTNFDDTQTVSGASLCATANYHLDFSLLKLSKVPPEAYSPYYAGWDREHKNTDTSICIHHPDGDLKKISKEYDALTVSSFLGYDSNKHWKVYNWDEGTTEPGSSGSGLFNKDAQLIGTLSGGDARCDDNFNDLFQQFYHDWDDYNEPKRQLNYWLDPFNFDPIEMNGYDPYKNKLLNVPLNFDADLSDSIVTISWQEPANIPDKYLIYKNLELFDEVVVPQTLFDKLYETGVYVYFARAVYSGEESKPSNMKSVVLGDTSTVPKITEVKVFPNPTSDIINIVTPDSIPMTRIEIYNNIAQKINSFNISKLNQFSINLSEYKPSLFLLKIFTSGDVYEKKVILIK